MTETFTDLYLLSPKGQEVAEQGHTLRPEPSIEDAVDDGVGGRVDEIGAEEDVVEDEAGAAQSLVEVAQHDAGGEQRQVRQEAEDEDDGNGEGDDGGFGGGAGGDGGRGPQLAGGSQPVQTLPPGIAAFSPRPPAAVGSQEASEPPDESEFDWTTVAADDITFVTDSHDFTS